MSRRELARSVSYGVLLILLFLVPLFITRSYTFHILIMVIINVILATSLRLISTSGQFSLGHGGMMAVGAYTSTLLVIKLGFSTWVALPLAGLATATLALLVGYPFVRLRGIYFAMGTIFLAEFVRLLIEEWKDLTGGTKGILGIPRPDPIVIPSLLNMDFTSRVDFYYFILILALITLLILYAIERSYIGRTLSMIQQDDSLSESVGVNTARYKVLVFVIGCFFAGIVGAFYSHYISALTPSAFGFFFVIYIVAYMVFGGIQRFSGPILGAFILTLIPEFISELMEYQPFVFAGVLMVIIFFLPEGLISLPGKLRKIIKKRVGHA